jgi:hypothetical protein
MISVVGPDGQTVMLPTSGLTSTYVPFTHPPISYVRVGGFAITDWQSREIEVFDGSGRLVRILRRIEELEPMSPERFKAGIDLILSDMVPEARGGRAEVYASMPAPPTIPAWAPAAVSGMYRMLLGGDGEIWIARFDPDDIRSYFPEASPRPGSTPLIWTAFDPEGRVAGTVHMPERFSPFELTPEGVLGVYRDEYEVEYIQHVRVERPSES